VCEACVVAVALSGPGINKLSDHDRRAQEVIHGPPVSSARGARSSSDHQVRGPEALMLRGAYLQYVGP
jgi:hypothetical protein